MQQRFMYRQPRQLYRLISCVHQHAPGGWTPRPFRTTAGKHCSSSSPSSSSSSSSAPSPSSPSSSAVSSSSTSRGQLQVEELPGVWSFTHPPNHVPHTSPLAPEPGHVSSDDPSPLPSSPGWVPFLIDSPHSGTVYPPSFNPALDLAALQQTEDSYVDELWAGAPPSSGCSLLAALFPRCFIDPNRPPDDIDPELLDRPWTLDPPLNPGPKTRLGIGLIRRLATPGNLIYNRRLAPAEVVERIACYHRRYHEKLEQELELMYRRSGHSFLLDAHSMKSHGNNSTPDGPGAVRPDVVVGDLDGTACAPWLTECVVESLRYKQYSVRVNDPYKGGYILRRHGRPRDGRHAVQVEVNRCLYMDEGTRDKKYAPFSQLQDDLAYVAVQVADAVRGRIAVLPGGE